MGNDDVSDPSAGGWVVPDSEETDSMDWVDMGLRNGDVITLRTRNTVYRLRVVDVDHRRVEVTSNGTAIPGPEIMVFVGSRLSMSGSMIRMGQFVIGLWVELSPTYERQMRHIVEDGGFKCYVLTATQEVFVNGLRIMPIGNKA